MNKSWLLDHRIIPQINQCRRLIQAEFGVRLHLTDEDLSQRLAECARNSRSATLNRLWKSLNDKVPGVIPDSEPSRRLYRGQPIAEVRRPANTGMDGGKKKQVIYRGRRIEW